MRVTVVVLCVSVCLNYKANCYIPRLQVQSVVYKVPYGVPNVCIVSLWILLKMPSSPVLALFADAKLLDF